MNAKRMDPDEVADVRHKVLTAFGELRRIGFIAKLNFSCCMSCAMHELGEIAAKQHRNRGVYFHRQDNDHFQKTGLLDVRYCYLPPHGIEGETNGIETKIGEQVADALRKQGLQVEWNGNPATTIQVTGLASQSSPEKEGSNGGTA